MKSCGAKGPKAARVVVVGRGSLSRALVPAVRGSFSSGRGRKGNLYALVSGLTCEGEAVDLEQSIAPPSPILTISTNSCDGSVLCQLPNARRYIGQTLTEQRRP